jgi:hypothetical protein
MGAVLITTVGALLWAWCAGAARQDLPGPEERIASGRRFGPFTGVALMSTGDLDIEIANRTELRIEGPESALALIEAEVVSGVLELKQREGVNFAPTEPVRFTLTVGELDRVEHAGSGRIRLPRIRAEELNILHRGSGRIEGIALEVRALSIHLSGSGEVSLQKIATQRCRLTHSGSGQLRVDSLLSLSNDVRFTGSGHVTVSEGSVVQQRAFVSGSGDFDAGRLCSSETVVMVSGSGSATVFARDQLDATITGDGSIYFRGTPEISHSLSGTGELRRKRF